jgi:hypothetical protein
MSPPFDPIAPYSSDARPKTSYGRNDSLHSSRSGHPAGRSDDDLSSWSEDTASDRQGSISVRNKDGVRGPDVERGEDPGFDLQSTTDDDSDQDAAGDSAAEVEGIDDAEDSAEVEVFGDAEDSAEAEDLDDAGDSAEASSTGSVVRATAPAAADLPRLTRFERLMAAHALVKEIPRLPFRAATYVEHDMLFFSFFFFFRVLSPVSPAPDMLFPHTPAVRTWCLSAGLFQLVLRRMPRPTS